MQAPFARVRQGLAVPFLLLMLAAGFYWKLTLTRQFSWAEAADQANRTLPWFELQAREIHAGRLPLWDPHQGTGEDLIGQVLPGTANPLNWVLFAFPLRDGHIRPGVLNWYWVLLHWLAAWAAYLLCREVGAGTAGSVLGAAAYGLGGMVGAAMWPQWVCGALWLPVALRYFLRASRGAGSAAGEPATAPHSAAATQAAGTGRAAQAGRDAPGAISADGGELGAAALGGAALGLAYLSGNVQVPFAATVVLAGLWIYALAGGRFRDRRMWARAGVFALVSILVGGLQTVPLIAHGQGAAPPAAAAVAQDSAGARAVPGLVVPGWSNHVNSFLGVTVMAFALAGILAAWRRREVRMLAAVAVCGLVLATCGGGVFQGRLYAAMPVAARTGAPATAMVLAHMAFAALAALGFDAWLRLGETTRRRIRSILLASGAATFAVYMALAVARIEPAEQRPMVTGLVALLLVPVLYAWERGGISRRPAAVLVTGLALLEAGTVSSLTIEESNRSDSRLVRMGAHSRLAGFLREQPGWYRVEVDAKEIPYRFGDRFGVDQMQARTDEERRLHGVRFYIGKQPRNGARTRVFEGEGGLSVFGNPEAGQAVFTTHDSAGMAACAQPDEVRVESRSNRFAAVQATMGCRGLLVMAAAAAPGWRVWVDRRPDRVLPVHGGLRGVVLEPGEHRLEFRYTPAPVCWGGGMTAAGLLLAAWLARRERHGWRGGKE